MECAKAICLFSASVFIPSTDAIGNDIRIEAWNATDSKTSAFVTFGDEFLSIRVRYP